MTPSLTWKVIAWKIVFCLLNWTLLEMQQSAWQKELAIFWESGFWQQLWLFQVSKRCLLDMYKDNPVTRKVKNNYELNGQQDSLKLNACMSSERIGKWWRKKDKLVKFSYSAWERKPPGSVVRVLSEITACQTVLPVLVIQGLVIFSWLSIGMSNLALDQRRWVKWTPWKIMMKWAILQWV